MSVAFEATRHQRLKARGYIYLYVRLAERKNSRCPEQVVMKRDIKDLNILGAY